MSLSETIEAVVQIHRKRYEIISADMEPVLMTFREGELVSVTVSPLYTDPDLKAMTKPAFSAVVQRDDADSYVFSSEAWSATQGSGEMVQPSQHPDRVETLIVLGCSPLEQICRLFEIIRDDSNNVINLIERDSGIASVQTRFNIYDSGEKIVYH